MPSESSQFLEIVFKQHYAPLRRFIRRLGVKDEQCDDIAQEVYFRLVRQNAPEKLQQSPRPYLFTIATNIVRDDIRKRQRNMNSQHIVIEEHMVPDEAPTPEQRLEIERKASALKNSILELPQPKRNILILNRFHSRSCPQIADEMGLPLRSVQRYLNEALNYCRNHLSKLS